MKTKLLILIISVIFGVHTISGQSIEKQVLTIRAEVAVINKNAAKYNKTKKDVEGVSLEGTEATYFTAGKSLRKITANMYGETFRATGEYYFQGENLIFAYEKMSKYNGSIGMKNLKVVKIEERRIYLVDGKIVRYLLGTKEQKSTSAEFEEETKSIISTADTLKKSF